MTRTGRFLAVAALAAVPLAACANRDAHRDDVVDALETAGATSDQAACVGDSLTDQDSENSLSQDELNDVAGADNLDDLDEDVNAKVQAALDECFGGQADGGGDTTETTDASETTTTTGG